MPYTQRGWNDVQFQCVSVTNQKGFLLDNFMNM